MLISVQNISIIELEVDAIVNAANNSLLGGGGVDGVIHAFAGPRLLEEFRGLGGCETGDAKITSGHNLKAKHVIHTVGPIWRGGKQGEANLLANCYTRSLELAIQNEVSTIAFPAISTGAYSYPLQEAANVAISAVSEFETNQELDVIFTVMGRKAERAFVTALKTIHSNE